MPSDDPGDKPIDSLAVGPLVAHIWCHRDCNGKPVYSVSFACHRTNASEASFTTGAFGTHELSLLSLLSVNALARVIALEVLRRHPSGGSGGGTPSTQTIH